MTIYCSAIEELAKIVAPCEYSWSEAGKNEARLRALAAMRYFFQGKLEGVWSESSLRNMEDGIRIQEELGMIPMDACMPQEIQ